MKRRSSSPVRTLPVRWQAYALAALVLLATLFGGGGMEGLVNNGALHALSALLLALILASDAEGSWPLPRAALGFLLLLLGFLVLVLVQIVPLPPGLWQSLPGRDLAVQSLALVGSADQWRPLSLDPDATRRVAAAYLLPAALVVGLLGATRKELLLSVRALVAGAAINALIGTLQLALGYPSWLTFYEGPNPGAASGLFANTNFHAALLAGALLCTGFLIRAERRGRGKSALPFHPAWLLLPFFVVVTLATGSRAGLILLLIAVPASVLTAMGGRSPLLWLGALALLAIVGALVALFSPTGNAMAIGQSFILSQDGRYDFLPDVLYTLGQYWPWGSGLGTFVPVFALNENLDVAGAGYINHAHNDLLEWLLETGFLGAILLLAAVGLLLWRVVAVVRRRAQLRGSQLAAASTGALALFLVALQSLADYPVRTAAISALVALAVVLLFSPFTDAPPRPVRKSGRRWVYGAAALAGLVVGGLALRIFLAEAAIRSEKGTLAAAIRPTSGRALALAAEDQLKLRNAEQARRLAAAAIERAPLNPTAVRTLAMSLEPAAALQAWRVASMMGWRDGATQLWALQQALANAEFEVAAVRTDAYLRTRHYPPAEYLELIRSAAIVPQYRGALLGRLALRPAWRPALFDLQPDASEREVEGTLQLLLAMAQSDVQPRRGEAQTVLSRLIERKRFAEAIRLHRALPNGEEPSGILDDGGFDRPTEAYLRDSTPFDWLLAPSSGAAASIEEQDGRHLFMETSGSAAETLLKRYVALSPGSYRLVYSRRGDPDSPEAIRLALRCAGGDLLAQSPTDPLGGEEFERRSLTFSIGQGCPLLLIAFESQIVGTPARSEFDDFAIEPLSGGRISAAR